MSVGVVTREQKLKKLLCQKNNYSFKKIKQYLGFDNDYELMVFLIDYLKNELDNFRFSTDCSNNKYLIKLGRYYNYSLGQLDLQTTDEISEEYNILRILNSLYDVNKKILDKSRMDFTNCDNNYIDNSLILDNLSMTISKAINKIKKKFLIEDLYDDTEKQAYIIHHIDEILKDNKNNEYYQMIIDNYKDLFYTIDETGNNYLFSKIVDLYFNSLICETSYSKRIYYNKFIDQFLNVDNIKDIESIRNIFHIKAYRFLGNIYNRSIEPKKEEEIVAAVNQRLANIQNCEGIFSDINNKTKYNEKIDFEILKPLLAQKENKEYDIKDFTNRYIVSIDSDEAKVFEQAISISRRKDKYLLSIYVPDMVKAISNNKNYDKKYYFKAIEKIPKNAIFDSKLAKKKYSLNEQEEKDVFAYQIIVDKDFNCYGYDIRRAKIKVNKNLKFSDFENIKEIVKDDNRLELLLNNLLDLTFSDVTLDDKLSYGDINMMNILLNGLVTSQIVDYCRTKNLPLIYLRTDYKLYDNSKYKELLPDNKNYKIEGVINTIGDDGIYDEDNFSLSLFSPVRKVSSLINQMLVCIYFVNKNDKLDPYTRNYLESQLTKITNNINRLDKKNRYIIENENEEKEMVYKYE